MLFSLGVLHKESTCNAGDLGLIRALGRSPGEGKDYPHQYSSLENSAVHGFAEPNMTERLSLSLSLYICNSTRYRFWFMQSVFI